jgi:demethylmenaquinone methyltransferase/2-methoxy-6-polyprenyl-1,4-benzoquinol methylase
VKAYYDTRAPEYDEWWRAELLHRPAPPGWAEERDELMAVVGALPAKRTLDVACGTGFVTRHLRGEVVGLDQSEAMLELARGQAPRAELVQGDALDLPFPDGSFERVFTSHFYGHLEQPEQERFLAAARRVAPELVVVDAGLHGGVERAEWQERVLNDGSRWQVFKRFFTPARLVQELGGGEVLHDGTWFVAVRSAG